MGLLQNFKKSVFGKYSDTEISKKDKQALLRKCYFEVMEQRRVLSADPVIAAVTYLEGDDGQDLTPDHFEVTFEGGSDTTQLTQFTINGDQNSSGINDDGDVFFDVAEGGVGTGDPQPFTFDPVNSRGVTAADFSTTVSADGLLLTVDVQNFEAGDVFAFTIDVDETERFRVDRITSGVEFEASFFDAVFVDPHNTFEPLDVETDTLLSEGFVQQQVEGFFFDEFDNLFAEAENLTNSEISLARDNETGQSDRTAGSIDAFELVPRPITISGTIYQDNNLNWQQDANESGIEGVTVELQRLNEDTNAYETVATTTTDANGDYEFGEELGIAPGVFRLVETQPEGFLSVGATPGSSGGVEQANVIGNIDIPLGGTSSTDNDFKQIEIASLEGNVFHDENNDGVFDANEEGIANVLIEVTRVGAPEGATLDPFADSAPIQVRTDADGHYSIDALPPGVYQVVQVDESSSSNDPLDGFIDGQDTLGEVNDVVSGAVSNDRFTGIVLDPGTWGVDYNFGEIRPADISGTVFHDENNNGVLDPNEERIGGVTIELFDKEGNLIAQTVTDSNGDYEFNNLFPGDYTVRQTQPTDFLDGQDILGTVDGMPRGEHTQNDEFCVHLDAGDSGVNYDFGEVRGASLHGTVFHDRDNDGVQEQGEEGIEGTRIVLTDNDGNFIAETLTDANGDYWFDNLPPGTYKLQQFQPEGFLDGIDTPGNVDGVPHGEAGNDMFCDIVLDSGDRGDGFNFGEIQGASLHGTVYHDRNNDGVQDAGEEGIEDTRIVLTDADGVFVAETFTDGNGDYWFDNLPPGTYKIQEFQPEEFIDGMDTLGSVDGIAHGEAGNDMFCDIVLESGDRGDGYNFGEIQPASIKGTVYQDLNNNGVQDEGEAGIEGTRVILTDAEGNVIAETFTDADGNYCFEDLVPGTFKVTEIQPEGFFDGIVSPGNIDGVPHGEAGVNMICDIEVNSGDVSDDNNFGETPPASIHGRIFEDGPAFETEDGTPPEDFRSQRDGIFQAGTDTPLAGVEVQLFYFIDPVNGSTTPRAVTLAEVDASEYPDITDPNAPITTVTNANGEYWFAGLQPGNYIVVETQPDGLIDSNDTPGTTTGFTFNSEEEAAIAPSSLLTTFSNDQIQDAIVGIQVESGGVSEANNFSEIRVLTAPAPPPPETVIPPALPPGPQVPGNPLPPGAGITGLPGLAGSQPSAFTQFIGNSRGASFQTQAEPQPESEPYTWHLSVVNGGLPRGAEDGAQDDSVWLQAGYLNNADWTRFDMDDALWTFTETNDDEIIKTSQTLRFGMLGGIPLAGDFDGDGIDEVAVFKDGYWMIDINRNGTWDETDLLAKLGDEEDRPVVGDWDGDGKDDIGIYGPIWERDREAIARDPGLPNPDNRISSNPKNVPPTETDATNGARIMKLTSYGKQRADVVDHVFGIGEREEIPVTGDWNGNGIRSIGTFQDGTWNLDVNGDGRFDHQDETVEFGQAGDIPIVGDFNGDGVEEIAVYRSGTWMIDVDGNRELDATDKTFQMGGANDKPVVGDWDGDGVDEPALYTESQSQEFN